MYSLVERKSYVPSAPGENSLDPGCFSGPQIQIPSVMQALCSEKDYAVCFSSQVPKTSPSYVFLFALNLLSQCVPTALAGRVWNTSLSSTFAQKSRILAISRSPNLKQTKVSMRQ